MRLVWCAAILILACGKSDRTKRDSSDTTGSGGDARPSAGEAGNAGPPAGEAGVQGGGPPAGGASGQNSATAGVPNAGTAGSTPSGGTAGAFGHGGDGATPDSNGGHPAGDGGAAGAASPEECSAYDACGCGCCSATPMTTRCYYPEKRERLSAIIEADRAAAANPDCAFSGCDLGARYVCCATPAPEPAARYGISGYSSDQQYNWIQRESAEGRCTTFSVAYPGEPPSMFPLDLPDLHSFDGTFDHPCDSAEGPSSATETQPIGVLGWVSRNGACWDFDFTVFLASETGEVDPIRFQANGVAAAGRAEACP